ncbi:uncharacterized protein [Ptychodera flava]|uniref:uncharacterized protein n=1 Tax=Ptychodera flava TaxID=63121 RepID=UPI003969F239
MECFAFLFAFLLTFDNCYPILVSPQTGEESETLQLWVQSALDFVKNQDCNEMLVTTKTECEALKRIPQSKMNLYSTGIGTGRGFRTVLPDSSLGRGGIHDSVLVLDPYPNVNFGHLVLVFYADQGKPKVQCTGREKMYTGDGTCLQLAVKNRCQNDVQKTIRDRHYIRRCQINFMPLVYDKQDRSKAQQLQCRDNVRGFAPCPSEVQRTSNAEASMHCALSSNSRRCVNSDPSQVRSRCIIWEICDQAVLISGGWSDHTIKPWHQENLMNMYNNLRQNGFKQGHITTFFADGQIEGNIAEESSLVYPATHKLSIRNHIAKFCRSSGCVDTLVIYLNSPTKSDGTMLLWDTNQNGIADELETYSVRELISDLQDCLTNHVYIIVDQSYSGVIIDTLSKSSNLLRNVAVYTSGTVNQYSLSNEFTKYWISVNNTRQCMGSVTTDVPPTSVTTSPQFWEGERNCANTTIYGAPCNYAKFFTERELKREYMGCQNLPTALWVMKLSARDSKR